MYLTYQFSKIIQCGTEFSDVAGYTSRLGQLMEALDALNTEMENIAIDFPHEESVSSDSTIRFEGVSFNTPSGGLIVSGNIFVCPLLLTEKAALILILQTVIS